VTHRGLAPAGGLTPAFRASAVNCRGQTPRVKLVTQWHWDPETYLQNMLAEVPSYPNLQEETARAAAAVPARAILELGIGTGETAKRVLAAHPDAQLTAVDSSPEMLARARKVVPGAELRPARLEDPLPDGPFDLVVSALAVHHLDGPGKQDLFGRIAQVLAPGGAFVLADVVVPETEADVVTPIDGVYDTPDRVDDQLQWLRDAGLEAETVWSYKDLAVIRATKPKGWGQTPSGSDPVKAGA
jgi:tRNA (cmo5U34)-methyltransferase